MTDLSVSLPLKAKVAYGSGAAVYATKEAAYGMFVLLFYTQVLGLSGTLAGAAIALGLIWDAVSDPLVGVLSDRLRSRWGRRHPLMFGALLPAGIGFIGLFSPPDAVVASQWQLAAWLLFWSLWLRTFVTCFSIPHLALSADLSGDYVERNQVMAMRMAFLFMTSLMVPAVGLFVIFKGSGDLDGRLVAHNYVIYGLGSCLLVMIVGAYCAMGSYPYRSQRDAQAEGLHTVSIKSLVGDILQTAKNKNFRWVVGYEVMAMMSLSVVNGLNMIISTYFWEFTTTETSMLLAVPTFFAVIVVMSIITPLSKRFTKQQLIRFAVIVMIIDSVWLYPLLWSGFLPPVGDSIWYALNFVQSMIFMGCMMLRAINAATLVSDACNESELETGKAQEGAFFSAMNLANKMSTVFGPVYVGICLDLIGLQQGVLPENTSSSMDFGLIVALLAGSVPPLFAGLYFIGKVRTGREDQADVQRRLSAMRAEPIGSDY
ncbi:MAG: MFS transporter [Halioglobus sp.]|nr:MFS transporter [Halioglobus sp.]